MPRCVVVTGMHRSGTSALAGLLHTNGVSMGKTFLPPPLPENPYGFFEDIEFRRLNDKLLALNNYNVKSYSPYIPSIFLVTRELRRDMRSLIDTRSGCWGFKDPRTCLTLHLWVSALPQHTVVVVTRRPYHAIGRSLALRGNCTVEQGERLAASYYACLEEYMRLTPYPVTYVEFEQLLSSPELVAEKLTSIVGRKITNLEHIRRH